MQQSCLCELVISRVEVMRFITISIILLLGVVALPSVAEELSQASEGRGCLTQEGKKRGGITQETIEAMRKYGTLPKGIEGLDDLTANNLPRVIKAYLDVTMRNVNGGLARGAADRINEFHDAHTGAAIGDALFRSGSKDGGEIIRRAVRKTILSIPVTKRNELALSADKIGESGTLDLETFEAAVSLSNSGFGKELQAMLAEERLSSMAQKCGGIKKIPRGEFDRFDYYR